MEGSDIKLDIEQRARAVALEPQVIDDPEWACAAIVWQRDQLADRDAEIRENEGVIRVWRRRYEESRAEIERLNTAFDRVQRASEFVVAEDGRRIYDLTVEIERLRALMVVHPGCTCRLCSDVRAVREARDGVR